MRLGNALIVTHDDYRAQLTVRLTAHTTQTIANLWGQWQRRHSLNGEYVIKPRPSIYAVIKDYGQFL
jgi:hypothetical protein